MLKQVVRIATTASERVNNRISYQYSETNVIHFFNLLRIMGLYIFRTLVAHSQDGTWYIACVLRQLAAPVLK
jgi:hypothetical protein